LVVTASLVGSNALVIAPATASAAAESTVAVAIDPAGGGWSVTANGAVTPFDGAPNFGGASGHPLNEPIVGMAATPDGGGYWLVASDGGIFTYGDAGYYGSTGAIHLNKPIVGMATTADGYGYWLVASDGGIFTFGDAGYYGSTGAMHLNKPIVGMAATPDGGGYWLVASDGGIFTFGDAGYHGSTGAMTLNSPIVGMAATPDGGGYWLVASDGGIFTFGDASFLGALTESGTQIVGMAGDPVIDGYVAVSSGGAIATLAGGIGDPSRQVPAGINLGGVGNADFGNEPISAQQSTMAKITGTGFSWIRIDIFFSSVEPSPGTFNWYTDPEIEAALDAGLHVDALISQPPAWGRDGDGIPDPAAFAAFASQVVTRYGPAGVSTWEIDNEENLNSNWGASVNPGAYASLLEQTDAAIKAIQPGGSSTVLLGGLAPAPDAGAAALSPTTFLSDVYQDGAGGSFDAVGIHPYSYPALPTDPAFTFANLPALHAVMAAHGDGAKQLWATEYGAPTVGDDEPPTSQVPTVDLVSPEAQAADIQEAFTLADGWSWMGPLFVFDWQDDVGDSSFGLLTDTGVAKPALNVIKALYGGS
jgi:hypothetical protein